MDESYYWYFSQNLDWGYFDHPPATAWFTAFGYALIPHEFGARLYVVIFSTLTHFLIWKIVGPKDNRLLFVLLFSTLLAQVGGFFIAPDISLLFFAALFLYLLKKYLEKDSWLMAIALGVTLAMLAYSKYHGALLVITLLVANLQLLRRPSFYLIPLLALALYFPHLYWQYSMDYPSFRFHWMDRSPVEFSLLNPLDFIGGQLLIYGPLLSIPLFFLAFKNRDKDQWSRTMRFAFFGLFGFFLLMSFRSRIEANWTAQAIIPMVFLAYHFVKDRQKWIKWIYGLAIPSLVLILAMRMYFMLDIWPADMVKRNEFHGWEQWAKDIKEVAEDRPVVFISAYQRASEYAFYAGSPAFSFDANNYSGSQYTIDREFEERLQGKEIMLIPVYGNIADTIQLSNGKELGYMFVENYQSFNRVQLKWLDEVREFEAGDRVELKVRLFNPTDKKVDFWGNPDLPPGIMAETFKGKSGVNQTFFDGEFPLKVLDAGESREISIPFNVPDEPGEYRLKSCLTSGAFFLGNNSHFTEIVVK